MRRSSTARAVRSTAPTFAALGDETRLRLVARLSEEGPLSITRLAAGSHVSRQAVTKHLRVLADAGLVANARDGRENVWQLERRALVAARGYLEDISRHWDQTLLRLKAYVES